MHLLDALVYLCVPQPAMHSCAHPCCLMSCRLGSRLDLLSIVNCRLRAVKKAKPSRNQGWSGGMGC